MSMFHEIQMAIFPYCVRLYSHTVRHAASPTRSVHVDMTLIESTVKVKVTGLLHFRKFSKIAPFRSIFSAILACSSKLMVDHDNTGPIVI